MDIWRQSDRRDGGDSSRTRNPDLPGHDASLADEPALGMSDAHRLARVHSGALLEACGFRHRRASDERIKRALGVLNNDDSPVPFSAGEGKSYPECRSNAQRVLMAAPYAYVNVQRYYHAGTECAVMLSALHEARRVRTSCVDDDLMGCIVYEAHWSALLLVLLPPVTAL